MTISPRLRTRLLQTQPRELPKLTRSELLLLLLLAMVQFTHIMDFMIMMPLGPQLMRLFSISPQQFGFLVSAYTFTAGASSFLGAFIVDRFDRKAVLVISYIGFTIGTLACAIAPNYEFLMAARSLAGAFGGILGAIILSVVGDAIHESKRGRAMGTVMSSFSLASVFGVPFGLYLATRISWHAPFIFVGGVAAINLLLLIIYMPKMSGHRAVDKTHRGPVEILSSISSDKNQVRALSLTILMMMGQFMVVPFLSPSMVANVGFTEADLPYIYFIGGGLTIFSSPFIGRLADRFGKRIVFQIASCFLLIPVLSITHLGPSPLSYALILTTLFFVAGNGRFVPAMAMVTASVPPSARGSFMSINSSVQSLAAGFASLTAGFIVASGPNGTLLHYGRVGIISACFVVIGIWVGSKLKPFPS